MDHIVELETLRFPVFNYRRNPNYAQNASNIWGMGFGLFMIAAPMMGWIDYNSPTLASILCFGGICEYISGFFNWYEGAALQSFMDFIFGLLHLTMYFTIELGKYSIPIPYDYYTYMQGTFYCIWLAMLYFLFMALTRKGVILYIVNIFLILLACIFAIIWHFSKRTWPRKASGYFLFFSSITLYLTGFYNFLNGIFRENLVPTVLPQP